MGDSGAARTLLSKGFILRDQRMEVVYEGGEIGTVVSKVQLGEMGALVVLDIRDNLADFADRGSTIMLMLMVVSYQILVNKQIVLAKDFGTLWLRLADIVDYNHKHDSHPAYAASILRTKLGSHFP